MGYPGLKCSCITPRQGMNISMGRETQIKKSLSKLHHELRCQNPQQSNATASYPAPTTSQIIKEQIIKGLCLPSQVGISLFHVRTSFLTTHSISACPISLYLCETRERELPHKLSPDVIPTTSPSGRFGLLCQNYSRSELASSVIFSRTCWLLTKAFFKLKKKVTRF